MQSNFEHAKTEWESVHPRESINVCTIPKKLNREKGEYLRRNANSRSFIGVEINNSGDIFLHPDAIARLYVTTVGRITNFLIKQFEKEKRSIKFVFMVGEFSRSYYLKSAVVECNNQL